MQPSEHSPAIHVGFLENFLFPGLSTTSRTAFSFACIAVILVAFLMELAKFALGKVEARLCHSPEEGKSCNCLPGYATFPAFMNSGVDKQDETTSRESCPASGRSQNQLVGTSSKLKNCFSREIWTWVLMGAGQMVVSFVSLLMMLLAMTMNVYILLSLVSGTTMGRLGLIWYKRYQIKKK